MTCRRAEHKAAPPPPPLSHMVISGWLKPVGAASLLEEDQDPEQGLP